MKFKKWTPGVVMTLFAALTMPADMTAQDNPSQEHKSKHHQYKLVDTGTLGGAISSLGFEGERDINNRGTLVSLAETQIPDPFAQIVSLRTASSATQLPGSMAP